MPQHLISPTESRLQSDCFIYHWNNWPEERGRLFMIYNNPKNAAHGAVLRGMGMIPGPSDLVYLQPGPQAVWCEAKLPGGDQSSAQIEFQNRVESLGFQYFIFHNLDEFLHGIGKRRVGL